MLTFMPQLDVVGFFPQLFWFVIVIAMFHVVLSMGLLPTLNKIFLSRNYVASRRCNTGTLEARYFWLLKVGITAETRPIEDLRSSTATPGPALRPTGAAFFHQSKSLVATGASWASHWTGTTVAALLERATLFNLSWASSSKLSQGLVATAARIEETRPFVLRPSYTAQMGMEKAPEPPKKITKTPAPKKKKGKER
jgi:hypothetical protein